MRGLQADVFSGSVPDEMKTNCGAGKSWRSSLSSHALSSMHCNPVLSVQEAALREAAHYGPVTALKFLSKSLLVGYGPFLRLYDVAGSDITLRWLSRVFARNKIHCIAISDDETSAVVAGGRSFSVVDVSTGSFAPEKAINEWIVAVEHQCRQGLLILTSHNEVLPVHHEDGRFSVAEKVHCGEKSILYSGLIRRCGEKIYVAAGTVMSGVLIWDYQTREQVHHLSDHEGSIFSVCIDKSARYVLTCSDDRSVKLYDFQLGRCLATAWGHGSRIWSLSFCEVLPDSVTFFSAGEDCLARVWLYDVTSEHVSQKLCLDSCHEGKHIWSGDAHFGDRLLLATGGADGKVRFHDVSEEVCVRQTIASETIFAELGVKPAAKEVAKLFVELPKTETVVVMTTTGRLFAKSGSLSWLSVEVSGISSFTFLRAFQHGNCALACTRQGDVAVLSFSDSGVCQTSTIPSQSTAHKFINVLASSLTLQMVLFMDGASPGQCARLVFFSWTNSLLQYNKTIELANPDPRAFSATSILYHPGSQWLVVGSRHANVAVYDLSKAGNSDETHTASSDSNSAPLHAHLIRKLSTGDTVTSIAPIASSANELTALFTVRDGVYTVVQFTRTNGRFSHEIVSQNKFLRGTLEGGYYKDACLYLYGFRSQAFFVWNESAQIEVDHEFCGGAHRQWAFSPDTRERQLLFSYVSKLGIHQKITKIGSAPLESGTHGREIRDVAVRPFAQPDGRFLVATASEDASVKVGFLTPGSSRPLDVKWTMTNHVSGLQRVKFLAGDYMASCAANEELLLWRLLFAIPGSVAVVEQLRLTPRGDNPDLRVMDFSLVETAGGFFLAAGFSNSEIRIYFYDTLAREFSLRALHVYGLCCILSVELFAAGPKTYLLAATTDGKVTLWDVSEKVMISAQAQALGHPLVSQQIHQSGVKAVFLEQEAPSTWRLLTGGDDNALVSSRVALDGEQAFIHVDAFAEQAASATITGLAKFGPQKALATSVDQVVRVWDYSAEKLSCVLATYTTVADTGCCSSVLVDGTSYGLVGGAGLSVFEA